MKRLYVLMLLAGSTLICFAQSKLALQQEWSFQSYGYDLGLAGLTAKDIDHDGRIEIIVTGATQSANSFDPWGYFSVISFNTETRTYETKWTSHVFFHEITELQLFDSDGDGRDEIFIGFDNGEINVINTTNYKTDHVFFGRRAPRNYFNSPAISSLSFGDIDNDGNENIVATAGDSTYVFDAAFKLKRKMLFSGGKITLANVDLDTAIETIYSKGHVVEYAGANRKIDMRFFPATNYGSTGIRVADMNKDGVQDVVYNSADTIHVLDVRAKKRIRSVVKKESYGNVSDFQLHDYTLDGVPDFFVGNEQFEVLYVYDGLTTQFDYSLQDPKRNGLEALVIADIDDEPGEELLWTSGALCSCSDHLFVYDMNSHDMKWMSKDRYVNSFEVADVEATPGDELLIGSFGAFQGYSDHGFLSRLNLANKGVQFDIEDPIPNNFIESFTSIKVGDIDDDGKKEILVGVENSYAFTMVYVYDEDFNYQRTLEIYGMSFIADMEIADIDDDHDTEVIVTSGTHISGSSHPDEYNNYIYIFDGKSGVVEWKSERLGGLSSRIGNIRVGNIDSDPAKEIVALRYQTSSTSAVPGVLVIDGWDYSLKTDESLNYNALDLVDFDKDGVEDIVAGTASGKIVVVDGQSFAIKKELAAGKGLITSLLALDINGDQSEDYIFTNQYKLHVFDAVQGKIAETDTLSYDTGLFGSIKVHDPAGPDVEILVNTRHTLYSFKLDSVPNKVPSPFSLLTPVNHAAIPSPNQVEFSWEAPQDDDVLAYSFSLSGSGLDTVVTNIYQTHIVMPALLFETDGVYSWSVTATDNFENAISEAYTFKVTDEVILAIDETSVEKSLSIYPNPFHSDFVIQNDSQYSIDQIVITDRNGQQQLTRDVMIPAQGKISVDEVHDLPSGIYLCSMRWNGSPKHTIKIAKY